MLPGGSFGRSGSGFRDDVRGFRKKSSPLRLLQTYAPVLVVVELIIMVVAVTVLRSSNAHATQQATELQQRLERSQLENKNLLNSIAQERQSRASSENYMREANSKLVNAQKELADTKANYGQQETHCKSIQESCDRTRLSLEAERDVARMELSTANQRLANLQETLATRERELSETAHRSVMEHSAKDAHLANKEAEWEAMRRALEAQIRSQGGYVPSPTPPAPGAGAAQAVHPDYAARAGAGIYHASQYGRQERYIDTAEELELEGVVDPNGKEHLAKLLGHLYELKVAEHTASQQMQPHGQAVPVVPIGHWMAQTLEGMGITCKYGVVHLAYVLDKHFTLEAAGGMVGRAGDTPPQPAGLDATQGRKELGGVAGQEQPVPVTDQAQQQAQQAGGEPGTPGLPVDGEADRQGLHAWRSRNQRQKVDAAGFVGR